MRAAPVETPVAGTVHQARDLELLFAARFAETTCTALVGGADEPLYVPAASPGDWHRIYYRADFFASALHEVAHWCIAGPRRRQLEDYGYWYAPEGRSGDEQAAFERVEARPQALEWIFAQACGFPFRLSFDSPELVTDVAVARFAGRVQREAWNLRATGLPPRAGVFFEALCGRYAVIADAGALDVSRESLRR